MPESTSSTARTMSCSRADCCRERRQHRPAAHGSRATPFRPRSTCARPAPRRCPGDFICSCRRAPTTPGRRIESLAHGRERTRAGNHVAEQRRADHVFQPALDRHHELRMVSRARLHARSLHDHDRPAHRRQLDVRLERERADLPEDRRLVARSRRSRGFPSSTSSTCCACARPTDAQACGRARATSCVSTRARGHGRMAASSTSRRCRRSEIRRFAPSAPTRSEGGFDADFLDSRLSVGFSGYRKMRYDALETCPSRRRCMERA